MRLRMRSCCRWNTMPSTSFNYSLDEVVVLVEEYESLNALRAQRRGIQIRLMDIDLALSKLSRAYREAVLLCGVVGLTTRTAGRLVGVSHETMRARYIKGLDALYLIINAGGHHS